MSVKHSILAVLHDGDRYDCRSGVARDRWERRAATTLSDLVTCWNRATLYG